MVPLLILILSEEAETNFILYTILLVLIMTLMIMFTYIKETRKHRASLESKLNYIVKQCIEHEDDQR